MSTFLPRQGKRTRRTVLKAIGLAGSTSLVGAPVAASRSEPEVYVRGESTAVGNGRIETFATRRPGGDLTSLGVFLDRHALAAFGDGAVHAHLSFPHDKVDTHQFTFMGFHYEPDGHEPPTIYDVPHFDFHFYFLEQDTVESIESGPATYVIPPAQIPEDYARMFIVEPEMGEHLVDSSAPEFQGSDFTHTLIYGAYDPEQDGIGRLTFVEPMVTRTFLDQVEERRAVPMKTPDRYYTADIYPTTYVFDPAPNGGMSVLITDFTCFPGGTVKRPSGVSSQTPGISDDV